jgi:hypothetical protein
MSEYRFRGSEIVKPRLYGNFRTERWDRPAHVARYQKRPGMSPYHLELLRLLPCCVTGQNPCGEVHHLKSMIESRGFGLRSEDRWGVPLSREPHDLVERVGSRGERAWFLERGIDPHLLAKALWKATGDLDRMRKVLIAHREAQAERKGATP